jgi:hypothetical protein
LMNSAIPVSARPVKISDMPETITRTSGTPSESAKSRLARGGARWRRPRRPQQTTQGWRHEPNNICRTAGGGVSQPSRAPIVDAARRWAGRRVAPQCRRRPTTLSHRPARQALRGWGARLQWRCQLPVPIANAAPNLQNQPPAMCSLNATARAELAMCFAVVRRLW